MAKSRSFILQLFAAAIITAPAFAESADNTLLRDQHYAETTGKIAIQRNSPDNIDRRIYDEEERTNPRSSMPQQQDSPAPYAAQKPAQILAAQPSALEDMYETRVGKPIIQFGYDLFGVPAPETQRQLDTLAGNNPEMPMGAVQDDFILQSGDELEITFTGQRTDHGLYKINSSGLLMIPDMPPIPAEGRSIGQVRLSVAAAARNLHNTDAYVSLSSVRQIGVLVVGHVKRPGRQTMTVFHTVIDALMAAGGVDKTGSLRQIKLVRAGHPRVIDLYSLLMRGGADTDLRLRDGDRLMVPSIGSTVAVAGEVKRPGIYEIPANADDSTLTLAQMLELGGGVLVPGRNRFLGMDVTRSGHEKVSEIHDAKAPQFTDGSVLMVAKGEETRAGTVELKGHTRRPGLYALDESQTLSKLLSSSDVLGPDAYPLIGVIDHRDPDKLARELIAFPLRLVLKGDYDAKLEDGDTIHIFSDADIRRLDQPLMQETVAGGNDFLNDTTMLSFLKERSAFVRGAIRSPGAYPVAEGVTLDSLMAVAGGPTLEADTDKIEITAAPKTAEEGKKPRRGLIDVTRTDPATIIIRSGDAVRLNQKFQRVAEKSVLIMGEVRNPGRYDLLPGDKVSDLLHRSGGLTEQAYPDGTIFSRESERKAEEARFRAQARDMQSAIAAALEQKDEKINAAQIAEARGLAAELESAQGVGRITAEADPAVLERTPEVDMLLESGDRIYIPKRSLSVRVSGEIFSPASLQFRKGKKARDYVDEAGGYTYNADKGRTFVIYPDGSAQPLDSGTWNYKPAFIPPGSTIVVPRDPKPFSFMESAKDISQILSNLAVTGLFIDDVRDDD